MIELWLNHINISVLITNTLPVGVRIRLFHCSLPVSLVIVYHNLSHQFYSDQLKKFDKYLIN